MHYHHVTLVRYQLHATHWHSMDLLCQCQAGMQYKWSSVTYWLHSTFWANVRLAKNIIIHDQIFTLDCLEHLVWYLPLVLDNSNPTLQEQGKSLLSTWTKHKIYEVLFFPFTGAWPPWDSGSTIFKPLYKATEWCQSFFLCINEHAGKQYLPCGHIVTCEIIQAMTVSRLIIY